MSNTRKDRGSGSRIGSLDAGQRVLIAAVLLMMGSLILLVLAVTLPIRTGVTDAVRNQTFEVPRIYAGSSELRNVASTIAGRRLVRPPRLDAAIVDTGAAAKALELLTLQSVVMEGASPFAYVRVRDRGVVRVTLGDHVLSFRVESISPGVIELSMDGAISRLSF